MCIGSGRDQERLSTRHRWGDLAPKGTAWHSSHKSLGWGWGLRPAFHWKAEEDCKKQNSDTHYLCFPLHSKAATSQHLSPCSISPREQHQWKWKPSPEQMGLSIWVSSGTACLCSFPSLWAWFKVCCSYHVHMNQRKYRLSGFLALLHKFLWVSIHITPESSLSQNNNSQMFSLPSQSFHKHKLRSEFFFRVFTWRFKQGSQVSPCTL